MFEGWDDDADHEASLDWGRHEAGTAAERSSQRPGGVCLRGALPAPPPAPPARPEGGGGYSGRPSRDDTSSDRPGVHNAEGRERSICRGEEEGDEEAGQRMVFGEDMTSSGSFQTISSSSLSRKIYAEEDHATSGRKTCGRGITGYEGSPGRSDSLAVSSSNNSRRTCGSPENGGTGFRANGDDDDGDDSRHASRDVTDSDRRVYGDVVYPDRHCGEVPAPTRPPQTHPSKRSNAYDIGPGGFLNRTFKGSAPSEEDSDDDTRHSQGIERGDDDFVYADESSDELKAPEERREEVQPSNSSPSRPGRSSWRNVRNAVRGGSWGAK